MPSPAGDFTNVDPFDVDGQVTHTHTVSRVASRTEQDFGTVRAGLLSPSYIAAATSALERIRFEHWRLRAAEGELIVALRQIISACGNPDAADGCRRVIAIASKALIENDGK